MGIPSPPLRYVVVCVVLLVSVGYQHVQAEDWTHKNNTDSCFEERAGPFPCSSTIVGNLILMAFYGAILGIAAKLISDGAEMLLDFGLPPGIIGGIVLPVLGAVPDSAIIIASGMGDDAQEKIAVGMGTLAGSTVMLLTIAWSASLFLGRCDLDEKDESIDKTCKGPTSLTRQGITLLPDIKSGIVFMMVTSSFYLIVQSADWYWGATLTKNQPAYVSKAALATMIICLVGLATYLVFSILDSKKNDRLLRLHREELLKRKVLHNMIMMTSNVERTGDESAAMPEKKFFKAWKMKTGTKATEEKLGLLEGEEGKSEDVEASTASHTEEEGGGGGGGGEEEEEECMWKMVVKCVVLLVGGVGLVTVFSDPMCDVLTALTNKKNKSFLPIPPFYVSFVVTPFCSNASELVSSLIFASKKTKENVTMTYSQIFGAATMNNTLCMAIFMALVYFKNLEWIYGAEVLCILVVQWVVGMFSIWKTYKLWMGIPVAFTYLLCILLVWALEYKAGWN